MEPSVPGSEAGEIEVGENIMFTSYLPDNSLTRSMKDDFLSEMQDSYKAVNQDYTFKVEMLRQGDAEFHKEAQYKPLAHASGYGFAGDGTLVYTDSESLLRWEDNVNRYGFRVTAGTTGVQQIQTTQSDLIANDALLGYSYVPLWNGEDNNGVSLDKIDEVNYRTSREWYAANKEVYAAYGQMPENADEYKKVPVFLKHQRSLITVILKADEGVGRDQLGYSTASDNISTRIMSYGTQQVDVHPLLERAYVNYAESDFGGAASNVPTVQYHAIVEPYNYLSTADEKPVCTVTLSGQKFSYYASNDVDYNSYVGEKAAGELQSAEAKRVEDAYNLKPGQHLILTVTLSRESRKIVISAYVEDWTEKVTTTICDDYGQNGDPEVINTRDSLILFLNSNANKSGAVAIIGKNLDLDYAADGTAYETPWPSNYNLRCQLNLAGKVITTNTQMFNELESAAGLMNGTIVLRSGKSVTSPVVETNKGSIERIDVITELLDAQNNPLPGGYATKGAIANVNYGSIYQCTSSLPVKGTEGYIGGIAAQSVKNGSKDPVISNCVVTARVEGTDGITASGGIVGNACGTVSNNEYSFGVTVLQSEKFKNIIGVKDSSADLYASDNSWPTTLGNDIAGTNANPDAIYAGAVSSQEELAEVLNRSSYNQRTNTFLLSSDFTVNSSYWTFGKQDTGLGTNTDGNVQFALDGNNKTITLDGDTTAPMLFTNIQNDIKDLTLVLKQSMIAEPSKGKDSNDESKEVYTGVDAIAPLGYSVYGATLTNIKVKTEDDKFIQAAMPGGIVSWAYGNAVLDACEFKGTIKVWLPETLGSQSLRYAGGIAALAERATFSRCMFHTPNNTLIENRPDNTTVYCGGILGGIARRDNSSTSTPLVTIKDCSSNFTCASSSLTKGAILGAGFYITGNSSGEQRADGLDHSDESKCEGNWWGASSGAVGTTYNNVADTKALGVRNSVPPTFNEF